MTITSDQSSALAADSVLDEYWSMYLRAAEDQEKLRAEAQPLHGDYQARAQDLAALNRRKESILRDIAAQEAMLKTVGDAIDDLTGKADQARRKAEMHAGHVARLVEETGRPHPQGRWEEANRKIIAEQFQQPHEPAQEPTVPPASAPPDPLEEASAASDTQARGLARIRSPFQHGERQ